MTELSRSQQHDTLTSHTLPTGAKFDGKIQAATRESWSREAKLRTLVSYYRSGRWFKCLSGEILFWHKVGMSDQKNVFGEPLADCCNAPTTGFYRTGCCETGPEDLGLHVVCAEMTADFLAFSKAQANDLSTPVREIGFPGLVPGDRWCLCVARWREALLAGVAPPVVLAATHDEALAVVTLDELKSHSLDLS